MSTCWEPTQSFIDLLWLLAPRQIISATHDDDPIVPACLGDWTLCFDTIEV